jgi:hypothetical protein
MQQLSAKGQRLVAQLAQRHGFGTAAVSTMVCAVLEGNGTMARFSHPEFGGAGQWTPGGRINDMLDGRVDALCREIAAVLAQAPGLLLPEHSPAGGQEGEGYQGGAFCQPRLLAPDPPTHWWPEELGIPSTTGTQHNVRYAYFSDTQRLAVDTGDEVWVYDAQDHQITGLAPQHAGDRSILFTSQFGTLNLAALPVISRALCANA